MLARALSSLRSFLRWDRLTHRSERLYEVRRGVMAFLHRLSLVVGGESKEKYSAFEEEVSREVRLAVSGSVVLETGCGPGTEATRLMTEFGAEQVIATDVSFGMLLAARKKCPQLILIQADALHLPFRENAVDVVYSNCMYTHIEAQDRKRVLTESLRVAGRCVLLKEIAGFESLFLNTVYMLYYSIVDGSAYRFTVRRWLEFLNPHVKRYLRRPESALVFRYVFFVLDASRK